MPMELAPVDSGSRNWYRHSISIPGASFPVPAHTRASILIDTGHLTTAYPELTVSGAADTRIRLRMRSALRRQGNKGIATRCRQTHVGLSDEFIARSEADFRAARWKTWRFCNWISTGNEAFAVEGCARGLPRFRSSSAGASTPTILRWRASGKLVGARRASDAHEHTWTRLTGALQYVGDTRIKR